jgi:arylformamidase
MNRPAFRQIVDITRPLRDGMEVWPGDPPFVLAPVAKLADGDGAAVSRLSMSTHCGTHVDAPAHVLTGGAGIDAVPLGRLVGPAVVVDLAGLAAATIERGDIVLLRTGDPPAYLDAHAADELIGRGVAAVGTDAASIERPDGDMGVHRLLLSAGVAIIENLRLDHVECGRWWLVCLPLPLQGADAAPARAVLLSVS